jgi:hypothetical protein
MNKHSLAVLKGKDVPVKAMKTYTGRRGTAPAILDIGTSWR